LSIRENLDPDSNTNEGSDAHRTKHSSSMASTDSGMRISINPLFCNVDFSICENLDPDSNVSEGSDSH
jgi:hypothetical protein